MVSSLSSNHLLISALAKRQRSKNPLQAGFTLVELLVVIIIIGILAAVALPAFLNQSDKAKANSAKTLSSAAAKECQVYLVEQEGNWSLTTKGGSGVTVAQSANCDGTAAVTFTATVDRVNDWTYSTTVSSAGAITARNCTGTGVIGCGGADPFKW